MAPARGRKRKQSSDEESESSESSFLEDESEEEELDDDDDESESEEEEDERPKRRKPAASSKAKKKPTPKKKPAPKKQPAKKTPAKKRGRKAKAASEEEDEEEDEVQPQEDEEEELDAGPDENDPGFDQTLFKDEADRAYLFSLEEREREIVLAERFDKWQRYEEWKRLRAERTNKGPVSRGKGARAAAQPSKRAGGVQIESDDEDEGTKPVQKPAVEEKPSAAAPKEESSSEEDEDEVSEGESPEDLVEAKKPKRDGDDWDEDLDDDEAGEEKPQADYQSVSRVVVTRAQILDWTGYPSKRFKQGLPGCLVKVLDTSGQSGERYELRMVTKLLLEGNEEYEVDREIVSLYFKVQGGPKNNTKRVPLTRISNKPLTQEEFAAYSKEPLLREIGRRGVRYIHDYLKQKLTGYVLTKEEALAMVEARKVRRGRASSLKNTAGLTLVGRKAALNQEIAACNRDRSRLSKELEKLESLTRDEDEEDEEDFEERKEEHQKRIFRELREANERVSKLEQELARVETRIAQDARRSITNETSIKLNELNEQLNRETIEKVEQLRLAQHASSQGQNLNPFLRRPTRPLMMWDTGSGAPDSQKSASSAPEATTTTTTSSKPDAEQPSVSALAPNTTAPIEVVDAMDVQPQQVRLKIHADAPIVSSTATKKFSLADYKMMKQQQQQQRF